MLPLRCFFKSSSTCSRSILNKTKSALIKSNSRRTLLRLVVVYTHPLMFNHRFPQRIFLIPKTLGCRWMLICFIILHMWSWMQLIWHGILLFVFRHLVKFSGRDSLLTLLTLLMMRVAILRGAHRDLTSLGSSKVLVTSSRVTTNLGSKNDLRGCFYDQIWRYACS